LDPARADPDGIPVCSVHVWDGNPYDQLEYMGDNFKEVGCLSMSVIKAGLRRDLEEGIFKYEMSKLDDKVVAAARRAG
jgi:hypothetical protein